LQSSSPKNLRLLRSHLDKANKKSQKKKKVNKFSSWPCMFNSCADGPEIKFLSLNFA